MQQTNKQMRRPRLPLMLILVVCGCSLSGWWLSRKTHAVYERNMQETARTTQKPVPTTAPHACSLVSMSRPTYPLRRKLMIVIFETLDRKGRRETAHVVDNFSKYCQRHGYMFRLQHYDADPDLGVFGTRWQEALKSW